MPAERGIAKLLAFACTLQATAQDDVLDVLDMLLTDLLARVESQEKRRRLRTIGDMDEAALLLRDVGMLVLDLAEPDQTLRSEIFRQSGTVQAEVLALETEKMLRIGWQDANRAEGNGADWTITWTLQPEGTGTRLFLVHEGFDPDNPVQQESGKNRGRRSTAELVGRTMARCPKRQHAQLPARTNCGWSCAASVR